MTGSSHLASFWTVCHQGVAPELARLWKARPRMPATVPVVRSTVIWLTRPKAWFWTAKLPMETVSLTTEPATWPEPYVTENGLEVDLNDEEAPVLNASPVVHLPVLEVPFALPPREGLRVVPCCRQSVEVTQRSLEIENKKEMSLKRVVTYEEPVSRMTLNCCAGVPMDI